MAQLERENTPALRNLRAANDHDRWRAEKRAAERRPYELFGNIAAGAIPVLGQLVGAYEAIEGVDIFGNKLGDTQRVLAGGASALPVLGRVLGKVLPILRTSKNGAAVARELEEATSDVLRASKGVGNATEAATRLNNALAGAKLELEVIAAAKTACFVAGTPILTPEGDKLIEQIRPGDVVLSRDENDPDGEVQPKVVEDVFRFSAKVLTVRAGAREFGTTDEHPFWVRGKGWVVARELARGDTLLSHDGQIVTVENVVDTGEWATVYNMRVADFHTYFVGCDEWGFSVWAHNADCAILFKQGDKWVLQSKVTGRTITEGTEVEVRAFAQKNGHDLTIPKAGDPLSAEHRASRWQEYQDSFKAGGERAGDTPLSQAAWDSKYNLNMGRMNRSQAGVNEYRASHAPWAEPGEVYLKPSELPEGVAARHYDIANRVDKRAIEFKQFQGGKRSGATMNNDVKKEIAADAIMTEKGGWRVEWVFKGYTSISKGVKEALDAAKIPYKIIP